MKQPLNKSAAQFWHKNKSKVLTGVGITGLWGAGIWGMFRTVSATRAVDAEKERRGVDKLPPKDIIKIGWKYYILPFSAAVASTGAVVASDVSQQKSINVLQAGLTLAEVGTEKIIEEAKKQIGEEATKAIEDKAKEAITNDRIEEEQAGYDIADIFVTGNGGVLFYEPETAHFFRSSPTAVANAFVRLKDDLQNGYVALNDWLNYLDLDYQRIGWELGLDDTDLKKLYLDTESKTVLCRATSEAAIVIDIGCNFHTEYVHRHG